MADDITNQRMTSNEVVRLASYLLAVTVLSGYMISSLWSPERRGNTGTFPAPNCTEIKTPKLTNVYPFPISASTATDIWLVGCNFPSTTVVKVNGVEHQPLLVEPNRIRVALAASEVSDAGSMVVSLLNGTTELGTGAVNVTAPIQEWRVFGMNPRPIAPEVRLLLLVLFTGMFGSSVYSLKSLGDYRGDNRLFSSWSIFYLIQPVTGMGIAFLLYVVIRGGFLSASGGDTSVVNQFGICAIAGLAGAFSDVALLKLREVFLTIFKPQDDRGGKIGLKITTTALTPGSVGEFYNQSLQATGGTRPLKWSVTPTLPSPLSLDSATGTITGTPIKAFPKDNFTFTVTDSASPAASISVELSLEIKARITTTALKVGVVGSPYNETLKAEGCVPPLKWSVNPRLPDQLTLDPTTGVISGTPAAPSAPKQFTFTVTETAAPVASATADLTLEIVSVAQAKV